MSMSKKDFIKMADMVIIAKGTTQEFNLEQLSILSDFCYDQNPNFKRERWFDYINGKCGKNGGKVK